MRASPTGKVRECDLKILRQWQKLPAQLVDAAAEQWERLVPHVVARVERFTQADAPLHQAIAPEVIGARLLPVLSVLTGAEIHVIENAIVAAILRGTLERWREHSDGWELALMMCKKRREE